MLPVYRSRLPSAAALLPYLERIDANHRYSNHGPLATDFERRLGAHLHREGGVTSASSGTAALEGAILAAAGAARPDRPLALMPSYTFVATAIAAQRCGYTPYFLDVDAVGWTVDVRALVEHPQLERVGIVIPVAPYGRAVDQSSWKQFFETTRIPVVIDGAAAFEALCREPNRYVGEIPVALSFQATKTLSTAEGGAVAWSLHDGSARVRQALNFGFRGERESTVAATNGKLSEYHAAVGLASLDAWDDTLTRNARVAAWFAQSATANGLSDALVAAPVVASNYALFAATTAPQARRVAAALAAAQFETRLWYGCGVHRQAHFRTMQHDDLSATNDLAPRLIGIPCFDALTATQIESMCSTIASATRGSA